MSEDNGSTATTEGTTETANRVEGKVKGKGKKVPKSKFREGFEFLRDAEGTKPQSSLVRKTEEGSLSLTVKAFPDEPTVEGLQEVARIEGVKAGCKSDVSEASATFSKSLAEESAEAWVEVICL